MIVITITHITYRRYALVIFLFLQIGSYAQEETVIDKKGTLVQIRNNMVTTSPTAPANALQNDIWFDTTAEVTKIYDGAIWLIINLDALTKKEDSANKSTDTNLTDGTNTKFPTELAVKTYVDSRMVASLDDDITGVSFDGTNLKVDEGLTTFSADLSGLRDSDWFQANGTTSATTINQDIYTLGNVGIGTNAPERELHIVGDNSVIRLSRSSNTATMIFDRYSGTVNNTLKSFQFGLNASATGIGEFFFADYNENVSGGAFTRIMTFTDANEVIRFNQYGAGNFTSTTATHLLGVESDGDVIEVDLSTLGTDNQTAAEVNLTDTSDNFTATDVEGALAELANAAGNTIYNANGTLAANRVVNQNNFDLNFDANTLVISGDDNYIGIGTDNPTNKLTVMAEEPQLDLADDAGVRLQQGYSESNSLLSNSLTSQIITNTTGDIQYSSRTNNSSNHKFYTPNAGTPEERMRISTNGNVGIGTTSPDAQLDIESTGVPLKITPSTTTPTGTQTGQIFVGDDGILYAYDGNRSKWLSVDRQTVSWARAFNLTTNEYLRAHNSASENNGYRMLRDATITGITAQSNTATSWQFVILTNDNTVSSLFLTLTSEEGKHANDINVDVNEGDYIQAYCLGMNIAHPLGTIEFAWRK